MKVELVTKIDWVTIVAVIFIICLVGWHQTRIDGIVKENVDGCNEHWKAQVEQKCPALNDNTFNPSIDVVLDYNFTKK